MTFKPTNIISNNLPTGSGVDDRIPWTPSQDPLSYSQPMMTLATTLGSFSNPNSLCHISSTMKTSMTQSSLINSPPSPSSSLKVKNKNHLKNINYFFTNNSYNISDSL